MNIGIIGTGIIASAIVRGFCTKKTGHSFYLSPRNALKAAALADEFYNVSVCKANQEVIDSSDWVFICLHKKDFDALLELKFRSDLRVVNMSAEMKLPDLKDIVGDSALLAHVIPLPFIADGFGPLLVYPEVAEVGELFKPVSDVFFAHSQKDVHTLQIVTGIMSAYYLLLDEVVRFSDEQGIEHDLSVKFACSLFASLCKRAASIPDCDLTLLANEMTPGGYNEQALNELSGNGAITAWRTVLDRLLKRLQESSKQ